MNILGLIPARGGSKSIPNKNIKNFNGKPLITYAIKNSLESKYITHTVVSTDSHLIAEIARESGALVPFLRPEKLARDSSLDLPVMEHAINWYKEQGQSFDYMVFLRPTNPFRVATEIDKAIEMIISSKFDSIRGVSEVGYSPYWMKKIINGELIDFINSSYSESKRQDLPKVFQANGTVDVIKIDTILYKNSRYGESIGPFIMKDISRIDIDTELDFAIAEYLFIKYNFITHD
jgi:CMP-N,N'-diacetyllegionaminic acid synthase